MAVYQFPEELKRVYESSPLSYVYYQNVDGDPVPILMSAGFCRNLGLDESADRDELGRWLGKGIYERMHPDDVGVVSRVSREFMDRTGPYDVIFRCRLNNKYEVIHGFGRWQTMPDGTDLMVIGYANVTEAQENIQNKTEEYIIFQRDRFYTDPLTGLPNVNYLHEFGNEKVEMIRMDKRLPQVVYCDIWSIQSYNNKYGFAEGNALLCLVAESLKEEFPRALVCRGADDHFILITGVDDREELTRRLSGVNQTIRKRAKGVTSGFRCGVSPVEADRGMSDALDQAKHTLKQLDSDINRVVVFHSKEADDLYWRNRYIVEHFDRALEEGWIKVYYQALYRVRTGKISAFEALARWVDPVRGIISPNDFIPVLQKYHLLYMLDLYMFEQVCREVSVRCENGLPLVPVSVNFSRQDFDHVDVAGEMNRLYDKYSMERYVPKNYFIVEITEQDRAVGEEGFLKQLEKIRENGYRLWLDDFGSGYSAINMFSQFEFDLIKYDMELMRHLDDNGGANRIILKELVYVARKLGIHTLIEGIETEAQLAFAREIECELVQGFYYSAPEPLDEILFRIGAGDKVRACETEEEREKFSRNWFD